MSLFFLGVVKREQKLELFSKETNKNVNVKTCKGWNVVTYLFVLKRQKAQKNVKTVQLKQNTEIETNKCLRSYQYLTTSCMLKTEQFWFTQQDISINFEFINSMFKNSVGMKKWV